MNGPFMLYKNFGIRLFRFATMHAFDRRTDRHATAIPYVFIRSRTVKHTRCSAIADRPRCRVR